jgi:hypothetical protein
LNGWLDEWVDGRLDGPMDISCPNEWEDGWMDDHEQTKNVSMHVTFSQNHNPNMKS